MIVLLTEEPSMKECLETIIPKLWPSSMRGTDWLVLSFQGKNDLERSIPQKMKTWNYGNPHFIILRDNDGGDCSVLKQKLCDIANQFPKPFHVRIVCQELESWLLGDLEAIRRAYPKATVREKAKFRKPDKLTNASQELGRLINVHAKIDRAKNISQSFDFTKNKSESFHVFINTLEQLIRVHGDSAETSR